MVEFLKKMADWVLQKEEEWAKNCELNQEDLQKQLEMMKNKKITIEKECQENIKELQSIIDRLEKIISQNSKCKRDRE